MSNVAVRVEGLGKQYRIGTAAERHHSLREALVHAAKAPLRNLRNLRDLGRFDAAERDDVVWALRDVSFEVKHGEAVAIVGRNGAGKSTLLKILSRITDPSAGRAEVHGRVGSLLEVGTGFHPELSGRENVFLNGSILGMDRAYIERKFDEIVEFSGVGKYVDTPVKRYSSGMYLRLAFAVAAHLEPEILVVDEVLAVGDAEFQKKCLGKMGEVAREGRTVLFVSHNMGAVSRLCDTGILLDRGSVKFQGRSAEVVSRYLAAGSEEGSQFLATDPATAPGNGRFRLRAVRLLDHDGDAASTFDIRYPITAEIEYDLVRPIRNLRVGFRLLTSDGTVVFSTTDMDEGRSHDAYRTTGTYVSRVEIPGGFLNQGRYSISLGIDVPMVESVVFVDNIVSFFVEPTGGVVGAIPDNRLGVVCPLLPWSVEAVETETEAGALLRREAVS
ncbi:MAG TPA: ABC transporter ATP-binding protein [Longimicrobiaceae bacterium]